MIVSLAGGVASSRKRRFRHAVSVVFGVIIDFTELFKVESREAIVAIAKREMRSQGRAEGMAMHVHKRGRHDMVPPGSRGGNDEGA